MDVVGAILLGWMMAGLGVVMLLNLAKSTVQQRSMRALQPRPSETSPAQRRELEPATTRPPAAGGRDPLIHFS